VVELPVRAAEPPAGEGKTPPVPQDARVLVVDDEEHVARVLGDLLEELGARIEITHSGTGARALLAHEHFDLITLDVIMPGENGVELWRQLYRDDPSAAARVVFVTGNVDPSIQTAIDSTGRPVLAKPYTFKALSALVANGLTRRGALPALPRPDTRHAPDPAPARAT